MLLREYIVLKSSKQNIWRVALVTTHRSSHHHISTNCPVSFRHWQPQPLAQESFICAAANAHYHNGRVLYTDSLLRTHPEPAVHVLRMAAVAAPHAPVRRPVHRRPADAAVQQPAAAVATRGRLRRSRAARAFGDKLDAARRLPAGGQVLQHLGARHEEAPAEQHLRVGALVVVVKVPLRVAQ